MKKNKKMSNEKNYKIVLLGEGKQINLKIQSKKKTINLEFFIKFVGKKKLNYKKTGCVGKTSCVLRLKFLKKISFFLNFSFFPFHKWKNFFQSLEKDMCKINSMKII